MTRKKTSMMPLVGNEEKQGHLFQPASLLLILLTRAHHGWINKGLPPIPFYNLWKKTKGDNLEKLIALGLIKEEDAPKTRIMGVPAGPKAGVFVPHTDCETGFPYAFVIEGEEPPVAAKTETGEVVQCPTFVPAK